MSVSKSFTKKGPGRVHFGLNTEMMQTHSSGVKDFGNKQARAANEAKLARSHLGFRHSKALGFH